MDAWKLPTKQAIKMNTYMIVITHYDTGSMEPWITPYLTGYKDARQFISHTDYIEAT